MKMGCYGGMTVFAAQPLRQLRCSSSSPLVNLAERCLWHNAVLPFAAEVKEREKECLFCVKPRFDVRRCRPRSPKVVNERCCNDGLVQQTQLLRGPKALFVSVRRFGP
jgi:hypothetical protein